MRDAGVGDILLLSTFTQGGAVTTIRVFEWAGWAGQGDTNGTLHSTAPSVTACPVTRPIAAATRSATRRAVAVAVPGRRIDPGARRDLHRRPGRGRHRPHRPQPRRLLLDLHGRDALLAGARRPAQGLSWAASSLCGATITTNIVGDATFPLGGSISDTATVNITGGGPAPAAR